MTVFERVLWMLVNIRLLGQQPRFPLPGESLIHYAAAIASRIVGLLGLTEAAEPLAPRLLVLLEHHRR
jgi:hypothetical protein